MRNQTKIRTMWATSGRKGNKQQNSSYWIIRRLLLYWVKVINYLVNCLFITPRRTTGNNGGLWSIAWINLTDRRNISGFQAEKRRVSAQGQVSVVFQIDYTWSHHKNPNRKRATGVPKCYLFVGAWVRSTEFSRPQELAYCGGVDIKEHWRSYDRGIIPWTLRHR